MGSTERQHFVETCWSFETRIENEDSREILKS